MPASKAKSKTRAKTTSKAKAKKTSKTRVKTTAKARAGAAAKTTTKTKSEATISQAALDLMVEFEVGGRAAYEERYSRPNTPHGYPGVMISIGYDVGQHTAAELRADCKDILDDATIAKLERACGVHGAEAEPLAAQMQDISISWDQAREIFRKATLPRWIEIVTKSLPNVDKLKPDSLGALVSLTFNRGPSFSKQGDRFSEMRAIRQHMTSREYHKIPGEFRAMKRLWPDLASLRRRRDLEAALFERGLA